MSARLALAAALCAALPAAVADAQAPLVSDLGGTAGYGSSCLGQNDDGSSNTIDITPYFPGGLRFFDRTHTRLFVNTNGNITFAEALPTYTPNAFPVAAQPMIAPFWADVDTRRPGSGGFFEECEGPGDGEAVMGPPCDFPSENGIWWHLSPGSGSSPARAIFTWDRVGYYQCHTDRRMSFQLILTAATGCGTGSGAGTDFDVEFRFNRCEWETGDASGGDGGFGGTAAQSGFDAGNTRDFVEIMGSRNAGIANRLCTESNVGERGVWRFNIRGGVVLCPDAGDVCTVPGQRGACAEGRTNCVGGGTECVQQVTPSAERCDAIDNDCDGSVDEMPETLCPANQVCQNGTCLAACFESGCPTGQVCLASGLCIDEGCESVTCPEGQRCVAGACVGGCEGVTCPIGQSCRGGACVDGCAGITCDDCTVCEGGLCVSRCQYTSCRGGETCLADGRCVETACEGVTCAAGTVCRGGSCVDACAGAVCPRGQVCAMGACVAEDSPALRDGGGLMPLDGGSDPGPGGGRGAVCACRAPGVVASDAAPVAWLGVLALLWLRRRGTRA